jgi:hypothetical protein
MSLWQDFKGGGGEFNSFFSEYKQFAANYRKWLKEELLSARPFDMPKTYNVDANLMKVTTDAAKLYASNEDEPFTVDAVVFLFNDWAVNKSTDWPYHPLYRNRTIGLLSKKQDGKWIMLYATLIQNGNNRGGYLNEYKVIDRRGGFSNADVWPHWINYKP